MSTEFPPGPGGIGQHAYSLATALNCSGKHVIVQTEADYSDRATIERFDAKLKSNSFRVIRNKRSGWKTYYRRIITLTYLLRNDSIDVLILTGRFSLWAGAILKYCGLQISIWSFVHGTEIGNSRTVKGWLTLQALDRANRIIAVSSFTRSLLPAGQRKRAEILANGLVLKEFKDRRAFCQYADWSGEVKLLTVGSISPRKGQHRVIRALPLILEEIPNLHYHIVGMSQAREQLLSLATSLGVENSISIHGKFEDRTDLMRAYGTADIFIMLSENQPDGDVEGFGISILEANYYGLPAIGSRGCGVEDAIKEGRSGFLVDGDNSEQILNAIKNCLLQMDYLRKEAKQWSVQHDWNLLVKKLIEIEST